MSQQGFSKIWILAVVVVIIAGGILFYQSKLLSERAVEISEQEQEKIREYIAQEEEKMSKVATTKWRAYKFEQISQDFKSPAFFDRQLVGIQDNGQRDIIVPSIKEALGDSEENVQWYPKEVSFPAYASKLFFAKYLSETGHSMALIMFDVQTLDFQELAQTGKIYQNYYNITSLVSPDGFKIASLGYDELYLLDLLEDKSKLLAKANQGEVFYPAKEVPDFRWLNNKTIQYPVYSIQGIYDPPIEIRQVSINGVEQDTEAEILNWQTYRNEELGFSFRYPSDWQIVNDTLAREKKATIFRENLQINNDKVPENPRLYLWVNPLGFGMPGALDIQYTLALSGDKSIKVIERTKFLPHKEGLSNVDGVTAISTGTTRLGVNSYAFFFQFSEGGRDYEPTFNQILSTFRLLE